MNEILHSPTIAELRKTGESLPMAFILRLFTARLSEKGLPAGADTQPREVLDPTKIVIPGIF